MTRWNDVPEHGDDEDLLPLEEDLASDLWHKAMETVGLTVLVLLALGLVFGLAGYLTGGHGA